MSQSASDRKRRCWEAAMRMCGPLFGAGKDEVVGRVLGVCPAVLRRATVRALLAEARGEEFRDRPVPAEDVGDTKDALSAAFMALPSESTYYRADA